MPTRNEYLNVLRKYLGYQGKRSAEQLDSFTANTSGKYNMFARYFDDLLAETGGPLNTNKQNGDYCAIGLLYSAIEACNGEIFKGFELLCQTWGNKMDNCAAGVAFMWDWFGYYKRQYNIPEIGDIGFVKDKKDGKRAHVCCVESISGNTINTIDFNWGNNVVRVSRDISEFGGFGRPKYSAEPEKIVEEPVKETEAKTEEPEHIKLTLEEMFPDESMLKTAKEIERRLKDGYSITDLYGEGADAVFYSIRTIDNVISGMGAIIEELDENSTIDKIKTEIIVDTADELVEILEADVAELFYTLLDREGEEE